MIEFRGRGILLDIEGTTSSVTYVYQTLFPYARERLAAYLEENWNTPDVQQSAALLVPSGSRDAVLAEALRQMDTDAKTTGLKQLQGLIWRAGFLDGRLRGHLYPDVPSSLQRWHALNLDVRIFSSGSVAAQKLYFAHSDAGDLSPYLNGYYDTTTGPKREPSSFAQIAAAMQLPPRQILFLSDVVAELDAAGAAGLRTALVERPGNAPQPAGHSHPRIETFEAIGV